MEFLEQYLLMNFRSNMFFMSVNPTSANGSYGTFIIPVHRI